MFSCIYWCFIFIKEIYKVSFQTMVILSEDNRFYLPNISKWVMKLSQIQIFESIYHCNLMSWNFDISNYELFIRSNSYRLKYQRFTTSVYKDIESRKKDLWLLHNFFVAHGRFTCYSVHFFSFLKLKKDWLFTFSHFYR